MVWLKWIREMEKEDVGCGVSGAATTIDNDGASMNRIHPKDMQALNALISRGTMWPALMRAETARRYCDVSSSAWKNYNAQSKIPAPYRLEGCVVWKKTELDLWIEWGFPGRTVFENRLKAKK